ncbi:MAG: hypothetical protein LBL80_02590 [Ruminococcus sp.]|jgi:hypothetical protein|nr:hypothetical protein [Ruminococcus sp.]
MIKGVNKRVIELNGINSDFFDKALLYIKPEHAITPEDQLDLSARAFLRTIAPRRKKSNLAQILITLNIIALLAIAVAIAALAYA